MAKRGATIEAVSMLEKMEETKLPIAAAHQATSIKANNIPKNAYKQELNSTPQYTISSTRHGISSKIGISIIVLLRQQGATEYILLACSRKNTGRSFWKMRIVGKKLLMKVDTNMKNMHPRVFIFEVRLNHPQECQQRDRTRIPLKTPWPTLATEAMGSRQVRTLLRQRRCFNWKQKDVPCSTNVIKSISDKVSAADSSVTDGCKFMSYESFNFYIFISSFSSFGQFTCSILRKKSAGFEYYGI